MQCPSVARRVHISCSCELPSSRNHKHHTYMYTHHEVDHSITAVLNASMFGVTNGLKIS
jgi:hypothetical protein